MLDQLAPVNDGRGGDGETEALLREMNRLAETDPRRETVRNKIVDLHAPIVRRIARRYAHRGEPAADIKQAAYLGLVKAINRYDPALGDRFLAYASPLMVGEVKRHFRDTTWGVHVPRRLQELRMELNRTCQDFAQEHGRAPTVSEVAKLLRLTEEETIEVYAASDAYRPESLDTPITEDDKTSFADHLGYEDSSLDALVDGETLRPLLDELPDRERKIVLLRFFGNKTQGQIGEEIGISQMHVSRLLSRSLAWLRTRMLRDE
jgi:RNA polymerase sigma-70 factor (sigma-B/F/G subfamily)